MKRLLILLSFILLLGGCGHVIKDSVDEKVAIESPDVSVVEQKGECPVLKSPPFDEWNPIFVNHLWILSNALDHVNMDAVMNEEGKMRLEEGRWLNYIKSQGVDVVEEVGIDHAIPTCFAYKDKEGYENNYNYCEADINYNGSEKKLVVMFERTDSFSQRTTALHGNLFNEWEFTNLKFAGNYCEED